MHDFCPTTGKATAPQRIFPELRIALARLIGTGHAAQSEQQRDDKTMRWSRASARLLLLILAGGSLAAEDQPGVTERAGLGEFIRALPPLPAPAISFVDL